MSSSLHSSKNHSVLLTASFLGSYGNDNPYRMDYQRCKHLFPILYPIVPKNVWGCFAHEVVTSVHISINLTLIASFVHATLDTPSTKNRLTLEVAIGRYRVKIQKA